MTSNTRQEILKTAIEAEVMRRYQRQYAEMVKSLQNAETFKLYVSSGEYDKESLLDNSLLRSRVYEDISFQLVLNGVSVITQQQLEPKRVKFAFRLAALNALWTYSKTFRTPLTVLIFLVESMRVPKWQLGASTEEIQQNYVENFEYLNAKPIFHFVMASMIDDEMWRKMIDIVLANARSLTELPYSPLHRKDEIVYCIAVVLLYAKRLMTASEITTAEDALKRATHSLTGYATANITSPNDLEQTRYADIVCDLLANGRDLVIRVHGEGEQPQDYIDATDLQTLNKSLLTAKQALCNREIKHVVDRNKTEPLNALQYLVRLSVPCVEQIFNDTELAAEIKKHIY